MHRLTLIALAVVSLCGVSLTGCGAQKAVTSNAPQPTAIAVASGTPPKPGRRRPESKSTAAESRPGVSQVATGRHDHAGQFCSGRSDARYAGEGLICVTGRLKSKERAARG
jgi:hypothetical protein